MVTLEDVKNVLNLDDDKGKKDKAVYGEVKAINADKTYQVSLNGSGTTVKCARLSGAKVGDTVLVEVLSNGYAVVTGTVGGDTDASDAQAAATAAQTAAGEAQTAASAAQEAAEDAETAAGQAVTKADAASAAAATADSKATAAGTAAAAAQTSADQAASAAATADSKADAASAAATRAETKADTASAAASRAETAAGNAETSAANAQSSADSALVGLSTVQDVVGVLNWITAHGTMTSQSGGTFDSNQVYFIQDNNGDYTVGGVRYSLVAEPKAADINSYYVLSVDESVQNYVATHIVVDGEGLWIIPDAGGNKVLIATGNGSSYTTAGTYIIGKVNDVDTVFAKFAQDGATITAENGVQIAHLGYGETEAPSGLTKFPFYTLGNRRTTIEPFDNTESYGWGAMCVYNGHIYVCVSEATTAGEWNRDDWKYYIGAYSHARGYYVTSCGIFSIADGEQVLALGNASHAVGSATRAIGEESYAEGKETFAIGKDSHAEGQYTSARGIASHAEGSGTQASGDYSHVQGNRTIASKNYQTAIGKYNIEDTETIEAKQKAFIVGNGTSGNRSNAFTVDWDGNTKASGDIEDGTGNVLSDKVDASSLATVAISGSYNDLSNKPSLATVATTGSYNDLTNKPTLATVATSGDYDDLSNKPSLPEIASGRTASITAAANGYKDLTVSFGRTFSSVPQVVCSIYSTSTAGAIGSLTCSALDVTTTGFKVRVFNAGSAQRSPAVDWIAING